MKTTTKKAGLAGANSKTPVDPKKVSYSSAIKIHAPKVVYVISSVYPTPFAAAKEAIQNAIDAGAKRVEIVIDLFGNRKPEDRCVIVRDNGKGLSREEFAQKMANIGQSDKAQDSETLGRHGLGLMSFLGKARYYAFISSHKASKGSAGWEGYTNHDLAHMEEKNGELVVTGTPLTDLTKSPQWWNTEVTVRGFEVRRLHIPLDSLEEDIRSDFNLAMLKHGTEVVVHYTDARGKITTRNFGARHYTGQRFKQYSFNGSCCGRTTFEMYRLKEQTGVVTIKTEEDSYTKDWRKLREQAIEQGMDKDLASALGSGYFEGVITVEKCEWDFDRRGFKPTDEHAWFELVMAIHEWMTTEDVERHLHEVLGRKEEEREFDLLRKLSEHFTGLYGRDADLLYEPLTNLPAAVSSGHTPIEGATAGYKGRTKVPGKVVRTETDPPKNRGARGDKGEKKNQTHFSVERDKGNTRYVSKTQLGLAFGIRSIGSYDYYCWDMENGILVINRDHPYYQAIRESDEKVWAYLLGIAEWAVCTLMTDEAAHDVVEMNLRQVEKQYMRFLTDRISQMKKA